MKEIKSLYIHFPFCKEICNYCDFYKRRVTSSDDFAKFEDSLTQGAKRFAELLDKYEMSMNTLETPYIGGGTPSMWGVRGIRFLSSLFKQYGWDMASDGEHTLEVNPEIKNIKELDLWREWGINRFSIGVQSCDDEVLKRLNRTHKFSDIQKSLHYIADSGVNFSLDLMLNLPSIKERHIALEIDQLLKFNPHHLSVYMMTVGNKYPHLKMMPSEGELEKEYLKTADILKSKGYEHYEVSNFSKRGYESKHNLRYWSGENVGALGISATGFFADSNEIGIRFKWLVSRNDYSIETLNQTDLELEKLYLGLRTSRGVSRDTIISRIGVDNLDKLELFLINNNYLASFTPIRLNSKGFLVLDSIIDEIFKLEN